MARIAVGGFHHETNTFVKPATDFVYFCSHRDRPPLVRRGDVLRMETGGGGGYGPPFDRPAEDVLEDVLGGLVSVHAARSEYGVVIADGAVDAAATAALRDQRPPVRAFHRHAYVDAIV